MKEKMDFVDADLLYSSLNSSLVNSSLGFNSTQFLTDISGLLDSSRYVFNLTLPLFLPLLGVTLYYYPLRNKVNELVGRVNELTDELEYLEDCLNESEEEDESSSESDGNGNEDEDGDEDSENRNGN